MSRCTAPVRVLHVFQPPDGGLPNQVALLCVGLAGRGHEVWAAGPAAASLRDQVSDAGVRFEAVDIVGAMPAPAHDRRALRDLMKMLRGSRRFDLVHAHGQKAGVLGRIAARRAGVPAIYTPHALSYRAQVELDRRGARTRARVMRAAERRLGRSTAALAAVSDDERANALGDRLVAPGRAHVVLVGVDPDRDAETDPELASLRGDGPLLGLVAALRDQKGLPTLLGALELLARQGRLMRFAIVGNGPLRDEVAARIESAQLSPEVRLIPFSGRVEPYLNALDALVLPSYWEGLPTGVLEAMFLGVPVVASAVGGTPEAVVDGETGLLFPSRDEAALADAMAAIASDPVMRERMGRAALEVADARFRAERMVADYEHLYRTVLG